MTALYWKATAGVLVAVILILTVGRQEKDLAMMLGILACVMTAAVALELLEPVLDFLWRLEALADFQSDILKTLLKIVGIGLTTELACLVCQDGGSSSLARGMQLLGSGVILALSLPIFETLLNLVQQILGER